MQAACLLPTLVGLFLLLGADVYEFSWRYQLPALVFAPLGGGGSGLTAMLRRSPPGGAGEEPPGTPPEDAAAPTEPSPEPARAR